MILLYFISPRFLVLTNICMSCTALFSFPIFPFLSSSYTFSISFLFLSIYLAYIATIPLHTFLPSLPFSFFLKFPHLCGSSYMSALQRKLVHLYFLITYFSTCIPFECVIFSFTFLLFFFCFIPGFFCILAPLFFCLLSVSVFLALVK